jgi:hypothetical protein
LHRPLEPGLAAVVSVVNQSWSGLALGDRHVERVQHQLGAQVVGHRPADDPAGEAVQHDREIEPAVAGALLGDVGHPQPVWCWWREVALDQIGRRGSLGIAAGQPAQPAAMHALQSRVTHESGDPLATNPDVQTQPKFGMHAWGAIGPAAAGMDLADLLGECLVS